MPTTFANPTALFDAVGAELGPTDWISVDQDRIDLFADATGDHQWIHVDPEKAADGPFGTTIAHGYLTLALANLFLPQLMVVEEFSMGLNYGVNRVRFPAPVPVGSRLRGSGTIAEVTEVTGGAQVIVTIVVAIEGSERPACIVDTISRFLD